MKKILLVLITVLTITINGFAQCPGCVIDTTCTAVPAFPALCPATLPNGLEGAYYDQNITFYMPANFTTQGVAVTLNQITVTGLSGMPPGLNWQTSASPTNIFYPSQNPPLTERGCVKICGTPTLMGSYTIIVAVTADVATPFGNITQNQSFTLPIVITAPPGGNSSFTYNPSVGCAPANVTFNGIITPQPAQIVTYDWAFGNGSTGNGQNPPVVNYAIPDTYYVSLTTKIYQYELTSVTANAVGTAWHNLENLYGVLSGPNLFFNFINNGVTQSVTAVTNNTTATWATTYLLSDTLFSLKFWNQNTLLANDSLALFNLNTSTGPGTFTFITDAQITGTYTLDTVLVNNIVTIDTVIILPSPAIPVTTFTGNNPFCTGDSVVLSANATATYYEWYNNDTTLIIGANNPTLTITQTGTYKVVVVSANGCSTASANTTITALAAPASPNLFQNGGAIISNVTTGTIEWLYNGVIIPNETAPTLLYGDSGTYTCVVTLPDECSNQASLYLGTPSGITTNGNAAFDIALMPNPAINYFDLIFKNLKGNKDAHLMIIDMQGKLHQQQNLTDIKNNTVIPVDISTLSNGIYTVRVVTNNAVINKQLIINK